MYIFSLTYNLHIPVCGEAILEEKIQYIFTSAFIHMNECEHSYIAFLQLVEPFLGKMVLLLDMDLTGMLPVSTINIFSFSVQPVPTFYNHL